VHRVNQAVPHERQVLTQLLRVAHVHPYSERAAHLGVLRERGDRLGHHLLEHAVSGPGVHPHRQMSADLAQRGRRVQPPPGQVQGVTGRQDHLQLGGGLSSAGDGIAVVGPGLIAQRAGMYWGPDLPAFGSRHLQHEDVVHVVVVVKAP